MTELISVFESEEKYHQVFVEGLKNMLVSDELGAFILVLANASFDKLLFADLQDDLRERFGYWQKKHETGQLTGQFSEDDVIVFEKLLDIGFDDLQLTRFRHAGIWQLQYNQLRGLRPPRNANTQVESITLPFNQQGFHFNKPFLEKEVFWQGEMSGAKVKLLFNKFPFANLHGLLLLDTHLEKPQVLDQQAHEFIWGLLAEKAAELPMGIGFNAMGAFASVNHQHFQSFLSRKKYPVELACWEHNGGTLVYPLGCRKFYDMQEAWGYLDTLHSANLPYNLLYRNGEVYCLTRRFQGSYSHAEWTTGFAWSETSGAIAISNENVFNDLTHDAIDEEFKKVIRL